jgi:hypothetical protein
MHHEHKEAGVQGVNRISEVLNILNKPITTSVFLFIPFAYGVQLEKAHNKLTKFRF